MFFKIYRGAEEIGGNLIEIKAESGEAIILDFGLPLEEKGDNPLPDIPELYNGEEGHIKGVLISHPHQDHYGLTSALHERVPVYIGEGAYKLIEVTRRFSGPKLKVKNPVFFKDRVSFVVGPFKVTPYLMDHSAFDSYAFLIEADGKRLFYTGDFRSHGRKKWCMDTLLRSVPKGIDALIFETTMLGRMEEKEVTEMDLEEILLKEIEKTKGIVLFSCSSQNIDRIVTLYRATVRSGRTLIMDAYTAYVLKTLGCESLPSHEWDRVRVYFNKRHMIKTSNEDAAKDYIFPFNRKRILPEEMAKGPEKYVMMFRDSMIEDFKGKWKRKVPKEMLKGARYIYSLWKGYLEKMDRLKDFLKENEIEGPIHVHSSGHAYEKDLRKLIEGLGPKKCIPIHGMNPKKAKDLFENVVVVEDGKWEGV